MIFSVDNYTGTPKQRQLPEQQWLLSEYRAEKFSTISSQNLPFPNWSEAQTK